MTSSLLWFNFFHKSQIYRPRKLLIVIFVVQFLKSIHEDFGLDHISVGACVRLGAKY
jgi:hypothetical protein